MIKKWARQRAVVTYGWLLGIALVSLILSVAGANVFFPPLITASVDVAAKMTNGRSFDSRNADAWADWHEQTLHNDRFLQLVAKRLGELKIDEYKKVASLVDRLAGEPTVSHYEPGIMSLTLTGKHKGETLLLLDEIVRTLIHESRRQVGMRSDGAVAVVRDERRVDGRTRYATLNDLRPTADRRFEATGIFFAILLTGGLLGMLRLNRWLLKTKRILDEQGDFFAHDGVGASKSATSCAPCRPCACGAWGCTS